MPRLMRKNLPAIGHRFFQLPGLMTSNRQFQQLGIEGLVVP